MRPSGYSGTDQAVIVIQSNTPEKLRILLSGSVNQIVEVPPCSDCEVFDAPPMYCPPTGETIRVAIEPGSYEVAIDSLENPGAPNWMGVWEFAGGKKYFSCFYQYSASIIS